MITSRNASTGAASAQASTSPTPQACSTRWTMLLADLNLLAGAFARTPRATRPYCTLMPSASNLFAATLAQVWRGGGGRQARISALLGLKSQQCAKAPLDTAAAKRIGNEVISASEFM
jgi:hypothetical protein